MGGNLACFVRNFSCVPTDTTNMQDRTEHQPGICYHIISRGNRKATVFHSPSDFRHFIRILLQGQKRSKMRILAYAIMPNHFHIVIWLHEGGNIAKWMHWLLTKHVKAYAEKYETTGRIWQGRYKSFPICEDDHLLTVIRYVERNPLTAGLVQAAEDWQWSSLRGRMQRSKDSLITPSPLTLPEDWQSFVNEPLFPKEYSRFENSIAKGVPLGPQDWKDQMVEKLRLQRTIRNAGFPRGKRRKIP